MTKALIPVGGDPRIIAPTTTTKVARRMLCALGTIATRLPWGGAASPALDILLTLHVAEEDARYLTAGELSPAGSVSPAVTERWLAHLVKAGLIDRRGDLLALSEDGHELVSDLIEAVFVAQRELD